MDAGRGVVVSLDLANRDPSRFADPERFDIRSKRASHLAFGHGVHQCVGAGLARLQLTVTLRCLLKRLPTLRLAGTARDVEFLDDTLLRGLDHLWVRW